MSATCSECGKVFEADGGRSDAEYEIDCPYVSSALEPPDDCGLLGDEDG